MRSFGNLINKKIYREIFLTYFIIILITILLISSILFSLFKASAAKEINNISQAMLSQTGHTMDVIYEQTFNVCYQLLSDTDIINFLVSKERDAIKNYRTVQKLSNIEAIYPFIKYISIYNGNTDLYINNKGISKDVDREVMDIIKHKQDKYMSFVPRKIFYPYEKDRPEHHVLSFIVFSEFSPMLPSGSALIINIDKNYIDNTVKSMGSNINDKVFIIDEYGTVLSHTDSSLFLEDFSQNDYIQTIIQSGTNKGHMVQNIDETKNLITFVKSSSIDWICISAKPYRQLLANIYSLRNINIMVSLCILFIGIILSLWITKRMYSPLDNLMEKIDNITQTRDNAPIESSGYDLSLNEFSITLSKINSLESSLKNISSILRTTCVSYLLEGKINEIYQSNELNRIVRDNFQGPNYCVLLVKIDNYGEFCEQYNYNDQALYQFAISNIANELIASYCVNDIIIGKDNQIAVIAQFSDTVISNEIHLILTEIQSIIREYFKISITIGLGSVVSSLEDIASSYQLALNVANYRFFFGHGNIIDYESIEDNINNFNDYPFSLEEQLISAITSLKDENINKMMDEYIETINSYPYHLALIYSNQLVVSIMKYFYPCVKDNNFEKRYTTLLKNISSVETLVEVSSAIKNFCFKISETLRSNQNNQNIELVRSIENYIKSNYKNPNLSLKQVANIVNLSPTYFGKLFKEVTHYAFNDYLNNVRLEEAKNLLISTKEPINTIAEQVGFTNRSYFFTLFKKAYAMTPSQFRKQRFMNPDCSTVEQN